MASMIRIPDELYRKAQAEAERRGVPVEELVAQAVQDSLFSPHGVDTRRIDVPIHKSNRPPSVTPDDVNCALEQDYLQEDLERGRSG